MIRRFFAWLFGDLIWPNLWWILGAVLAIVVILFILSFFLPDPEDEASQGDEGDAEAGSNRAANVVGAAAAGGLVQSARDGVSDDGADTDLSIGDVLGGDDFDL